MSFFDSFNLIIGDLHGLVQTAVFSALLVCAAIFILDRYGYSKLLALAVFGVLAFVFCLVPHGIQLYDLKFNEQTYWDIKDGLSEENLWTLIEWRFWVSLIGSLGGLTLYSYLEH
jgi:hypothetical protein